MAQFPCPWNACRQIKEISHVHLAGHRRAVDQVPEVTVTAIDGLPGVDIEACAEIANRLGARFGLGACRIQD